MAERKEEQRQEAQRRKELRKERLTKLNAEREEEQRLAREARQAAARSRSTGRSSASISTRTRAQSVPSPVASTTVASRRTQQALIREISLRIPTVRLERCPIPTEEESSSSDSGLNNFLSHS